MLLSSGSAEDAGIEPPDPEEKRLSHELDFGANERHRRTSSRGGGVRRVVIPLILLIIVAGIVAIIFKTEIVGAVPALASIYGQFGL